MPPPTLYNIVERVWPELKPDAAEDAEYVGDVAIFVNEVPTEVQEPALRKWLLTAFNQHTDGLHAALMKLKDTEDELNLLETTIERLAKSGAPIDDEEAEQRKSHTMRLEIAHLDALEKLVHCQSEHALLEANGPLHMVDLFKLAFVERHSVTSQHQWSIEFADTPAGRKWAFLACHIMDYSAVRLGLKRDAGAPNGQSRQRVLAVCIHVEPSCLCSVTSVNLGHPLFASIVVHRSLVRLSHRSWDLGNHVRFLAT